jgi:hypothetical protein
MVTVTLRPGAAAQATTSGSAPTGRASWLCNAHPDCHDESDEKDCPAALRVRLEKRKKAQDGFFGNVRTLGLSVLEQFPKY